MLVYFKKNGVSAAWETDLDHAQLHALWVCATKHGCHIQVPVRSPVKAALLNIRTLDTIRSFDGVLLPSGTLPPPPDSSSGVPPPPG